MQAARWSSGPARTAEADRMGTTAAGYVKRRPGKRPTAPSSISAVYVVVGSHPRAIDPTSAQMPVGGFRTPTAVDTDSARRPCLCGRPRHESRSEGRRHILPEPLDGRPAVASDRYTDSGTRSARLRRSVSTNLLPRGCRERRNGEPAEKTEPRTGTAPTSSPSRRAAQRGRLNPAVRYGGVGDEHVIRTVRMKDQPDRGGPDPRGARARSGTRRHCFGSYSHGPTRRTPDDF